MKKFALFVGAVAIALGTANVGAQAPVELKVGDTAPAFSLPVLLAQRPTAMA